MAMCQHSVGHLCSKRLTAHKFTNLPFWSTDQHSTDEWASIRVESRTVFQILVVQVNVCVHCLTGVSLARSLSQKATQTKYLTNIPGRFLSVTVMWVRWLISSFLMCSAFVALGGAKAHSDPGGAAVGRSGLMFSFCLETFRCVQLLSELIRLNCFYLNIQTFTIKVPLLLLCCWSAMEETKRGKLVLKSCNHTSYWLAWNLEGWYCPQTNFLIYIYPDKGLPSPIATGGIGSCFSIKAHDCCLVMKILERIV